MLVIINDNMILKIAYVQLFAFCASSGDSLASKVNNYSYVRGIIQSIVPRVTLMATGRGGVW